MRTKQDVDSNRRRHEQYARRKLPVVGLTIAILKSASTSMVPLQHSNACICESCEVGNGPAEGLQSHPPSQLFVASDVHQFRHGLAHVRRVAMPNGTNKISILFTSDLTRAVDTVPSFVQWDVAQRWPVMRKVALGTNVRWLGNGITTIQPRMRSQTFEASTTVQQQGLRFRV